MTVRRHIYYAAALFIYFVVTHACGAVLQTVSIKSGTIVLAAYTPQFIIVAADSRTVSNVEGFGRRDDYRIAPNFLIVETLTLPAVNSARTNWCAAT